MKFVDGEPNPILCFIFSILEWFYDKIRRRKQKTESKPDPELIKFLKSKGFHFEEED